MSFANVSDIIATTIESRSGKVADNVLENCGLLSYLKKKGKVRKFTGGRLIYEELAFAENANGGSYSGYDPLPVAAQDVISAAEFNIKQYAVPVTISGLERIQNKGKEQIIDLLEARLNVAESTMMNLLSTDVYSDGTGNGGKNITGLDLAIPADPTTGSYGGISRVTWSFWRSQLTDPAVTPTSATLATSMNALWAKCTRGADHPDLILADDILWSMYMATLQTIQRVTDSSSASLGFPAVKYMGADVVLDGGIGGNATASTMYFINTKYLHWRPDSEVNMSPIGPKSRYATNQDAEVQILGWAGNLTCSGARFQGRLIGT